MDIDTSMHVRCLTSQPFESSRLLRTCGRHSLTCGEVQRAYRGVVGRLHSAPSLHTVGANRHVGGSVLVGVAEVRVGVAVLRERLDWHNGK